jgi:hypothetical protein
MAGVELARRSRSSNEDDERFGPSLGELCTEIEADRETLVRIMELLDIDRGKMKPAGAWLAEKLGRLKLNGQLSGYSPLSRLVEIEALAMGVAGKAQLWRALGASVGSSLDGYDFEALARRAVGQREKLEQLQLTAVSEALAGSPMDSS